MVEQGGWARSVAASSERGGGRGGREIAIRLRVEHSIHREDGAITEKNSYGNDPNPPKDKN